MRVKNAVVAAVLWVFLVIVSLLIVAMMMGCDYDAEPYRTVTIQRCLVCGDWLVDLGYCTTCDLWFEVVR